MLHRARKWGFAPAERTVSGRAPAPVSVVIPCFNSASTIPRALASIAAQTVPPAEVFVVDDGSTDASPDLVESLAREWPGGRLKLIRQQANLGPSAARNAGWKRAGRPWVAFLDADDAWHPRKLEVCLAAAAQVGARVDLVGHRCPARFGVAWEPVPRSFRLRYPVGREMLWRNILPTSSVMLRSDIPYRFEPAQRRSEDYLLWTTVIIAGVKALWLDLALAQAFKFPYGEDGLSGDLWAMEQAELGTYRRLVAAGLVSPGEGLVLQLWSLAKFVRRCLITCTRMTKVAGTSGEGSCP